MSLNSHCFASRNVQSTIIYIVHTINHEKSIELMPVNLLYLLNFGFLIRSLIVSARPRGGHRISKIAETGFIAINPAALSFASIQCTKVARL